MPEIDNFFNTLIRRNGSDLHLKEGQKPKIRINGQLTEIGNQILTKQHITALLSSLLPKKDWQQFESKGDFDFAYSLGEHARFRGNYHRHLFGIGAAFRLVPSKILSIEELGVPLCVKNFAKLHSGLILITGPTGSGKSTTLASIIDYINTNYSFKIITIEDPVEFIHYRKKSLICHREVGRDTASFANGLRSAIKCDVDIILVGEMRDIETMELALTASEMGILVLSTLHTSSAAKTVDRIVDSFPSNRKNHIRTILANNLKAIVAQQLLPSIDLNRRYAAFEVLLKTQALNNIIHSGESIRLNSEIEMNRAQGMRLMDDSLMELLRAGKISNENAYLKANNKTNFS
ncbi:MAG: PilT/PilU family type 4a pilus ATPase [Candidatus Omnitrophota bacterium]